MISGIKPTGVSPFTGISPYNNINLNMTTPISSASAPVKAEQLYDEFRCVRPTEGNEGQHVRQLTAQISQKIRIRPTNHELSALRQQIHEGSYRPDASAIASRMLMMAPLED